MYFLLADALKDHQHMQMCVHHITYVKQGILNVTFAYCDVTAVHYAKITQTIPVCT